MRTAHDIKHRMLDAARGEVPSPQVTAALWSKIEARAAAGDLGPSLDGQARPGADASRDASRNVSRNASMGATRGRGPLVRRTWRLLLAGAGTLLIAGLVVRTSVEEPSLPSEMASPLAAIAAGTRSALTVEGASAPPRAPEIEGYSTPTAPADGASAPAPATAGTSPRASKARSSAPVTAPAMETSSRIPRRQDAAGAAPTETSGLSAELALLQRSRTALKQGHIDEAARFLDEHARRFARGTLAEEREATRLVISCRRGEFAAVRRQAKQFQRRFVMSSRDPAASCPEAFE